jgi:Bacterial membrane protein YfhO
MGRTETSRKGQRRRVGAPAVAKGGVSGDIPRWVAPVVFVFVIVVLFREAIFGGATLLGADSYALSYFARDFYTDFVRTVHRFPAWDPLLLGGIPFVEGMHGDIFYPPSLALFFLDARAMWPVKMMLHYFLAGVFTYMFLRGIGVRRGPALFGGLVYMMGADLVSLVYPGGDGKLFVSALAPLAFYLTDRAARSGRLAAFALFALGVALVVFTSHMQLAYFTVWGVSLFFFFRLWQRWRTDRSGAVVGKLLGLYVVAGVLGVAAAAVQFVPPLQYLREYSQRADRNIQADPESAYQYATTYALHAEEIVSLVVPEFVGDNILRDGAQSRTYWGRNDFKINHEYAGLVPLLLGLLLFVRRRTPESWFFAVLGILALLYALGSSTPFFRLFYLIPGVDLFRAPSVIIFLYGFSVAVLGALGCERLMEWAAAGSADEHRRARHSLWVAVIVFAVLGLLASAGAVTGLWQALFDVGPQQAQALAANERNIQLGFWIAFLLALLVALTWEAAARAVLSPRGALIALSVLAALDLYRVGRPFIEGTILYQQLGADPVLFEPDETITFLQQQARAEPPFRVYDLAPATGQGDTYGTNVLATNGLEQVGGHHGNEIGRYKELVGGDDALNVVGSGFRLGDLLGARYFVSNQLYDMGPNFTEAFRGTRSVVYRNERALPRAFLVGRTEIVPDEGAPARILQDSTFDPRTTVLLPEPLPAGIALEPDPQGTVAWQERRNDAYTLEVTTDRPALLVLTENYYPGWHATVDGAAVETLRANYTLRAVPVPAGTHTVRFTYRNGALRASAIVSVVVLLGLAATALSGFARRREQPA